MAQGFSTFTHFTYHGVHMNKFAFTLLFSALLAGAAQAQQKADGGGE